MDNLQLSGVQLLVRSLEPHNFPQGDTDKKHENPMYYPVTFDEHEEHHCALCGGLLTEQHSEHVFQTVSECWISSQELADKTEEGVCSACEWMVTNKNRTRFLPMNRICVFDGSHTHILMPAQFLDFLQSSLPSPCLIAVQSDMNRMRKHTAWKLDKAVTYGRQNVCVSMFGLKLFGNMLYEGTARFDAVRFTELVRQYTRLLKELNANDAFTKQCKGKDTYRYVLGMKRLYFALKRKSMLSDETVLAVYLAANIANPAKEKSQSAKTENAS